MITALFRKVDDKITETVEDTSQPLKKAVPKAFLLGAAQGALEGLTILGAFTAVFLTGSAINGIIRSKK